MATTNRERVGKALDLLREGLGPFVAQEMRHAYKADVPLMAARLLDDTRLLSGKPIEELDVAALLKLVWDGWNEVFTRTLGRAERSLVAELRDWRNKWAHQEPFSGDDAYRALDSAARLLTAIAAPQAEEVERLKRELLRRTFDEQVRSEQRKAGTLIEPAGNGALKPWREVINPHQDVASGRYRQAEFAADLWQVYLGEAMPEYQDPVEFFRRTYLTESLRQLLVNAARRLSGLGGEPVVQLQTNFGGGKTHAMLALYHLCSGLGPQELPGVEALLAGAGVSALPATRRVVLVGNRISPGNPSVKPDGTTVRTLWGELAWQLGLAAGGLEEARRAYERVRADDELATSPGDALRELLNTYGPCLILIDEWVAYARQLHDAGDLPGGSFETQFTFAQTLTESARQARACLLVISLPASEATGSPYGQADDIEVGGLRGREALDRLRNVIGRMESPWRPATREESYEIVRRRLFEPLSDPAQYTARDVTARVFVDFYRRQRTEFPATASEAEYERRLKTAYPIHPELFDLLYDYWSTLATFQRTRGVLRLMATVIHVLWERGDRNPLILPSTIPLDDTRVQFELTRYLSENWVPVIDHDVDGEKSLPVRLDAELPTFGKYHACRRVARTIFLGSAPIQQAANRGNDDQRIRLGCVMPGESPAVYGDALRRLAERSTYLYQDGARYWYSTQPTVAKLAEDRAEQLRRNPDIVTAEIERRVREDVRRHHGDFSRVHAFPRSSADVPDDLDARLVILGIDTPHARGEASPAQRLAEEILQTRGSAPRLYRNTLAFLAVDRARVQDLEEAVRRYLAWTSILADRDALDLAPHQVRQAEQQKAMADQTVQARLPEAFSWLLVPESGEAGATPGAAIAWQEIRLQGNEGLAARASRRLVRDELLITTLGPNRLRIELDQVPLWRGDHVPIRQVIEDFARYLYLPRLKDPSVLVNAVREGVALLTWAQDSFAYAESFDDDAGRYRALRAGEHVLLPATDPPGLLVKSEVAVRQREAELVTAPVEPAHGTPTHLTGQDTASGVSGSAAREPGVQPVVLRRFHGSVALEAARVGRDAGRVGEEIIAHLLGLAGSQVRVTLEIEASFDEGVPEHVVRIITENCRALKFDTHAFEPE